uniref:Uncharacterized protein n=1 Tax=Romanomermis culicivorax TaxID=13658 RepID=A0A915J3D8_ROMCU
MIKYTIRLLLVFPSSSSNPESADVEEKNLVKFLTLLANDQMKTKSDRVKFKFHRCIRNVGFSSHLYARCLTKLMYSKNVKKKKSQANNKDENLAYDVSLMEKWNSGKLRIKKQNFSLLNPNVVNTKSTNFKKTTKNQNDLIDIVENLVDLHYKPMEDSKDRANQIVNHVSDFFQFVSKTYRKSTLAMSMSRDDSRNEALKILSPRFLTMDNQDNATVNLLSPEFFSLYDTKNHPNNILPIAAILEKLDLDEKNAWRQFIAEVATTVKRDLTLKTWNRSVDLLYKEYGLDDEMVRQKVRSFFDTLNIFQLNDLNNDGFASMNARQLRMLDDSYAAYKYRKIDDPLMQRGLREAVANLARSGRGGRRQKRALAKGCVLKSTMGAAVVFTHFLVSYVVLCPATLGIFILGSFLLTPYVLSPFLLFPFILAPFALTPVVLTPFALSPVILAPAVLSPFVLSPFILSPFILSPIALTPIILSPSALSPLILCPGVLSPGILSPGILNAAILSPCALCG